jgi:hypothetical protein
MRDIPFPPREPNSVVHPIASDLKEIHQVNNHVRAVYKDGLTSAKLRSGQRSQKSTVTTSTCPNGVHVQVSQTQTVAVHSRLLA